MLMYVTSSINAMHIIIERNTYSPYLSKNVWLSYIFIILSVRLKLNKLEFIFINYFNCLNGLLLLLMLLILLLLLLYILYKIILELYLEFCIKNYSIHNYMRAYS